MYLHEIFRAGQTALGHLNRLSRPWLTAFPAVLVAVALVRGSAWGAEPDAQARVILGTRCSACHRVPGVPAALGDVGPSLKGIASRPKIAGKLPNNRVNMIRWLMHPKQAVPGTRMPDQGLTQDQASAIAVYLAGLK